MKRRSVQLKIAAVAFGCAVLFWWSGINPLTLITALPESPVLEAGDKIASILSLTIAAYALYRAIRFTPPAPTPAVIAQEIPAGLREISLIPPQPMPDSMFQGRESLTTSLVEFATRRRPRHSGQGVYVLHSVGGAGKSSVAERVAAQAQTKGVTVWWISATSKVEARGGLQRLAAELGADEKTLDSPDSLWKLLEARKEQWLLVIDNADDPTLLAREPTEPESYVAHLGPETEPLSKGRGWLRPVSSPRGMVLVTSRDSHPRSWGAWCTLVGLEDLSVTEGARILTSHAPLATNPDFAQKISAQVDNLPLALTLLGSYVKESCETPTLPGSITSFEALYTWLMSSAQSGVLVAGVDGEIYRPEMPGPRAYLLKTWKLTMGLLENRGLGAAQEVMYLLSSLATAPIPLSIMSNEVFRRAIPSAPTLSVRQMIQALSSFGLVRNLTVTSDHGPAAILLHGVVRETMRIDARQTERAIAAIAGATDLLYTDIPVDRYSSDFKADRTMWFALLPHAQEVFAAVMRQEAGLTPEVVKNAARVALACIDHLDDNPYLSRLIDRKELADTCVHVFGHDDIVTFAARRLYADHLVERSRNDEAIEILQDVATRAELLFGEDGVDTLLMRAYLARSLENAGQIHEAVALLRATAEKSVVILGPDDGSTLYIRNQLGNILVEIGHTEEAFTVLVDTYRRMVRTRGRHDPLTIMSGREALSAAQACGKHHEAGELIEANSDELREAIGDHHPFVLSLRHTEAMNMCDRDPQASLRMHDELIADMRQYCGEDNPLTLATESNRIGVLAALGDYRQAAKEAKAHAARFQTLLGDLHPDTIRTKCSYQFFALQAGLLTTEQCLPAWLQLEQPARDTLGPLHETTVRLLTLIGQGYVESRQYDLAERYIREAIDGYAGSSEQDIGVVLANLLLLAECITQNGSPEEGYDLCRQVIEAATSTSTIGPHDTFTLWARLQGATFMGLRGDPDDLREAIKLTREVHRDVHRYQGDSQELVAFADSRLTTLTGVLRQFGGA